MSKHFLRWAALPAVVALGVSSASAWADTDPVAAAQTAATESQTLSTSGQFLSITGGEFVPQSVSFSNGSYNFNYSPQSLSSAWVEATVGAHLFDVLGGFYLEAGLGFTSFSGTSPSLLPGTPSSNISVAMFALDPRLMYQMTWFPVKFIVPFVDGGYQFTLYYQGGPSDLQSAQGIVGNAVAGAGVNIWLNRAASTRGGRTSLFSSIPIYLTAKVNQIFPCAGGLDLASRSFLGGISLGL